MRQLKVTKTSGSGTIDQLQAGWSVQCAISPTEIGGDTRLGSASFGIARDPDSKFLIDNDVQVRQTELGGFDGNIREVSLGELSVDLSVNSILSRLDVERTAGVYAAGTFERNIAVPVNMPYVANAVTYYTGQQNNFDPITVNAIASDTYYIYVEGGGSSFPAINVFRIDGTYVTTYADYVAGDTAFGYLGTAGVWMTVMNTVLYVGRASRSSVRMYNASTGVYIGQWGTNGSGNGQFNTISGLTNDGTNIYTTEYINGRVQKFNSAGTYVTKWGTSGSGAGDLVFYQPHNLVAKNGVIWVPDQNARIRQYSNTGTFIAGQMGLFDATLATGDGSFVRGSNIGLMFDHNPNSTTLAYTVSNGVMKEWAFSGTLPAATGRTFTMNANSNFYPTVATLMDGTLLVAGTTGVDRYTGSLGSVASIFQYYMALAYPNMPIDFALLEPNTPPVYVGWRDNVWKQICDLAAATGNSITLWDTKIHIYALGRNKFTLPDDVTQRPVSLSSRPAGRSVTVINYNSSFPVTPSLMYDASVDNGGRVYKVDIGDLNYANVNQNTYPTYLTPPAALATATYGTIGGYVVYDNLGVVVTPATWANYGGAVIPTLTSEPGTIQLMLRGPNSAIPGFTAPFGIGTNGAGHLKIYGIGVVSAPEQYSVGTGVEPSVTTRAVAESINSPFCNNSTVAYTQASWVAYNSGTPEHTLSLSFDTKNAAKLQLYATGVPYLTNTLVLYDEVIWIVNTVNYSATTVNLSLRRHTPASSYGLINEPSFEEIWSGAPAGNFESYWKTHVAQDFTIAPLRNPYGVPTRAI